MPRTMTGKHNMYSQGVVTMMRMKDTSETTPAFSI